MPIKTCPCGGASYQGCCAPYLETGATAETAEILMRSRYSAYVLGRVDYLTQTHLPELRDEFDAAQAASWAAESQWQRLEVGRIEGGGPDDEIGFVEFTAHYLQNGKAEIHRERSRFVQASDTWYYARGERPEKVARNAPCPCGSGKKSKRCCYK